VVDGSTTTSGDDYLVASGLWHILAQILGPGHTWPYYRAILGLGGLRRTGKP